MRRVLRLVLRGFVWLVSFFFMAPSMMGACFYFLFVPRIPDNQKFIHKVAVIIQKRVQVHLCLSLPKASMSILDGEPYAVHLPETHNHNSRVVSPVFPDQTTTW